ncbi:MULTISPECIES: GGDEF domain-containing protein [unclassified Xanthobacter]|uniref:GGDEF domain-containing protein n=1 Tax=unclassified Xanthobacter TaxID=2623496 RepID=UPI001EE138A5|nr:MULTISPECIES: GGDEF domain-containing protein [unclassified Xanthobacter]
MQLDFQTLYVIILLNSVAFCVVWAGFAFVHRQVPGARFWLASSLATTLGGVLMSGDASAYGRALMVSGNVCVVFGFGLIWAGTEQFYGRPQPRWRLIALMAAVALVAGVLADDTRPSQNVAYAVTQVLPLGAILITLLRRGRGSLGSLVAVAGVGLALCGQATEATLNLMRIAGHLSTDDYYAVASLLLVAVIIGASLWNLGFLLMAIDRLHAKLAALALFDDLTGLPNRRAFLESLEQSLTRVQTNGRPLSLMMVDLDRFKDINDSFGHGAGDACLQHFAALCVRSIRAGHMVARLGGDEFGIILEGLESDRVAPLAERLVALVAASPLHWRGRAVPLSASLGIAMWHGSEETSVAGLIEEADLALYETKRRGRNGYTLGQPPGSARTRLASRAGAHEG